MSAAFLSRSSTSASTCSFLENGPVEGVNNNGSTAAPGWFAASRSLCLVSASNPGAFQRVHRFNWSVTRFTHRRCVYGSISMMLFAAAACPVAGVPCDGRLQAHPTSAASTCLLIAAQE